LSIYRKAQQAPNKDSLGCNAFLTTLGLVLVRALMYRQLVDWQVLDVMTGLWTMCLLVVCYKQSLQPVRVVSIVKMLSWKPLVFIGTFAYSLYLTHAPLLQLITQFIIFPMKLHPFNATMILIVISLPICIGFAYIFFLLFEKPFLTLGKKVKFKEVEAIAAVNPAI
jgi:peptidoglycan/LPS O-acetylase OafA/YrhL